MSATALPGAVHRRQRCGRVIVRLAHIATDVVSWFDVRVYLPAAPHRPVHHEMSTSHDEAVHHYRVACEAARRAEQGEP